MLAAEPPRGAAVCNVAIRNTTRETAIANDRETTTTTMRISSGTSIALGGIFGLGGALLGYVLLGGVIGTLLFVPIALATMVSTRILVAPPLDATAQGSACPTCGSLQTEDLGDSTLCHECGHVG